MRIGVVSAEELIAPVSRERHCDTFPCHGTHQKRCDLGRVRHRLVKPPWQLPQESFPLVHGKNSGLMFSPEVLRHLLRRLRLVERRLPEAYRKGLHRCVRELLHLRGDQARIHSVAQKGPQRHVADHPEPDRVLKQCVQLFRRVLIASGKGFLPAHDILYGPVTPLLNPLRRPLQDLPREQPESVSEDALPSRDIFRRQVHGQRVPVDLFPEAGILHDRFQLGGEDQRIAVRIII